MTKKEFIEKVDNTDGLFLEIFRVSDKFTEYTFFSSLVPIGEYAGNLVVPKKLFLTSSLHSAMAWFDAYSLAEKGYDAGYKQGHDDWYKKGYDAGYKKGHDDGCEERYNNDIAVWAWQPPF